MTAIENERQFQQSDANLLMDIMTNRRDVRGNRFIDKPINDKELNQILDAAINAPSVGFSQPWEFVLIRDTKIKQQIKDSFDQENTNASKLFIDDRQTTYNLLKLEGIFEAPLNIAVFYNDDQQPVLGKTSMPETGLYSVVCAIQNMWLMARALNIGMGWVSIINPEEVKSILKAEENKKLVGYLCLGYTKGFLKQPELELLHWEKRKASKDIIFNDTY
ncbi:5,6-dimethylbenzimidazole synthase [Pedobacter sp. PAMC26386]|nr:5,6-dimethylbenzimidazole synthase [Pedobacter sp. PAMC26386]